MESLATLLRSRGRRVTPQRVAVLDVLKGSHEHLCADQIYERVRVNMPSISLATVYKALNGLKEMGQVRALPISGKIKYEVEAGDNHHHMICERCKTIVDVPSGLGTGEQLPDPHLIQDFHVSSLEITYKGLCSQCFLSDKDQAERASASKQKVKG